MRKNYLVVVLVFSFLMPIASHAQHWVGMMQDPDANFYDVQQAFNNYREEVQKEKAVEGSEAPEEHEEENGFMLYRRWEEFMEPRVFPSGLFDPSSVPCEYAKYLSRHAQSKEEKIFQSNWNLVSPANKDGIGCLNFVRFHPTDPNTVYAGAATGGLWKSADAGVTWTTNTDTLGTLSMADMAIDPTNPNVMYLATGGSGYAIGLLKSTDGGISWNSTGLNNVKTTSFIINPGNPSIVLASTSSDVYRSTDGGSTFQKVLSGTLMRNLMFKPGDPNTVYITGWNTFYRSTDGGVNFTAVTAGLPPAGDLIRMAIATTPADPDYVYVLTSSLAASDFYGLYLSTDAGQTFTLQSNTPNIVGSQGWFALCIAASPVNKTEVVVGGLNIYRSVNSGTSWSQISTWNVSAMTGKVHVDIHDLQYYNSTSIFAACDGGLFKTVNSGSTWSNLSAGLQVAQSYSVGISQNNPNLIIIGTQDNGTKTFDSLNWKQNIGGDGATCFIDWSSDSYRYASLPQGGIAASVDGGVTYNYVYSGISETTNAYLIPWLQDPDSSTTVYAGFTNVWKSKNRGTTWSKISNFTGGGVKVIAVCAGDNRCLCAVTGNKIYRTTDGGVNWINITGTLPVGSASISDVVIKDADTNKIWVSFSGTSDGNKVFETSDGGITWNNISGTLPNLPANTLVCQKNSPDGLYLGMDIGVYYHDTILNSWELFNTGLPNAGIRQLKIQHAAGKLRASTYGRGIWESDLYVHNPATVPVKMPDDKYSLKIFPNPAGDNFEVSFFAASKGDFIIELRNFLGQVVCRKTLKNVSGHYSKAFNLAGYGKGVYFVSLSAYPDTNHPYTVEKVMVIN